MAFLEKHATRTSRAADRRATMPARCEARPRASSCRSAGDRGCGPPAPVPVGRAALHERRLGGEALEHTNPSERVSVARDCGDVAQPLPIAMSELHGGRVSVDRGERHLHLGHRDRFDAGVPRDDESMRRFPHEHLTHAYSVPSSRRSYSRPFSRPSKITSAARSSPIEWVAFGHHVPIFPVKRMNASSTDSARSRSRRVGRDRRPSSHS